MASDHGPESELTEAIVTCEGNLHDPDFSARFQSLLDKLKAVLYKSKKEELIKVRKIEPWNSVRVTISIPKEAAQRLRQLAQQGSSSLRQLGILSVQVEGDQVISLTLAGKNGSEAQQVVLQQNVPGSSPSSSFTPTAYLSNLVPSGSSNSSSSTNQSTLPGATQQFIFQQSTSGNSSDFRIPNVVAPSPGESLPIIPPAKPGATGHPPRLNHGGPFPFASMTHAVHTMQRVENASSGGSSPASIPSSSPSPQNVSVAGGGQKSTNFLSVTTQPPTSGTPTGIPIVQLQGQPGTLLFTQPPNNNAPTQRFIYSNSSNSVNVSSNSAISQATAAAAVVVSSSSSQSLQIQFVNVNSSNSSTPYSQSTITTQPQSLQFKLPQSAVSGTQPLISSIPGDRPVSSPLLVNLLQHGDTNGTNSSSPTHSSQQPRASMPPPPLSLSVDSPKVKRYQLLQQQRKLKRGMSLDTTGLASSPASSPTPGALSEPASPSDCATNILTSVEGQRTLTIYPSQQQSQGNFRMPQLNQQLNQTMSNVQPSQHPQLVLRQQTTNQLTHTQPQHTTIQQNQQIQMVQQQISGFQQETTQQNQVLLQSQQQSSQQSPQNPQNTQLQQYQLHINQQGNQRLQQPQFQLQIQQQQLQVQKQTPQGQTITQQQIIHLQQPQQYQIQGHHIRATGVRFVQQQPAQNQQFVTLTTSNSQQLQRQIRPQQFVNSNQGSVQPPTLVNSNPSPPRAQYTMLISSSQTTSQHQQNFASNPNIHQQSQFVESNQQLFPQTEQPVPHIQPKTETEPDLLFGRLQSEQTGQLSDDLGARNCQSKPNSNETYTKGTFLAPNAPPPRLLPTSTKPLVRTVPSQVTGGKKPFGKKDPTVQSTPVPSHTSPGKPLFLINPLTGHLEPMAMSTAAACVTTVESSESEEESDGLGKKGIKKRKPKTSNKADVVIGGTGTGKPMSVVSLGKPGTGSPNKSGTLSTEKIKLRLKIEKNEPGYKELPILTPVSGQNTPSASTEPRVPPLHISLRGKNSAVVVSPRRDDLGLTESGSCDLATNLAGSLSDKSKTKSNTKSKPGKLTRPRTSNEELMSDSMPYIPGKIRHKSASLSNESIGDMQLSNANIITTSQNKPKKKKKSDATSLNSAKPSPVIRSSSEKCSITSTLDDLLESINRENDEQEKLEAAMALAKEATILTSTSPLQSNSSVISNTSVEKSTSFEILPQPPAVLLADDEPIPFVKDQVEEPEKIVRFVDEMRLRELEINVRNVEIGSLSMDSVKNSLTEVDHQDQILPPSPITVSLPPILETVIPSKLPDDQLSTNGNGSTGLPGEDSGIDSMDALSEKSPNNVHNGESPARKDSLENSSITNLNTGSPVPPTYNNHENVHQSNVSVVSENPNTGDPVKKNEVFQHESESVENIIEGLQEPQLNIIPQGEYSEIIVTESSSSTHKDQKLSQSPEQLVDQVEFKKLDVMDEFGSEIKVEEELDLICSQPEDHNIIATNTIEEPGRVEDVLNVKASASITPLPESEPPEIVINSEDKSPTMISTILEHGKPDIQISLDNSVEQNKLLDTTNQHITSDISQAKDSCFEPVVEKQILKDVITSVENTPNTHPNEIYHVEEHTDANITDLYTLPDDAKISNLSMVSDCSKEVIVTDEIEPVKMSPDVTSPHIIVQKSNLDTQSSCNFSSNQEVDANALNSTMDQECPNSLEHSEVAVEGPNAFSIVEPEPILEETAIVQPNLRDETCALSDKNPLENEKKVVEETVSSCLPAPDECNTIKSDNDVVTIPKLSMKTEDGSKCTMSQNEIKFSPLEQSTSNVAIESELVDFSERNPISPSSNVEASGNLLEACNVPIQVKIDNSNQISKEEIIQSQEGPNTQPTLDSVNKKETVYIKLETSVSVASTLTTTSSKPIPNLHPISEFNSIPVSVLPRFESTGPGPVKTIPPIIRPQIVHMHQQQHNSATSVVHLPNLVRPNAVQPPPRHLVRPIPPLAVPKAEDVPGSSGNIIHLTQDAHGNILTLSSQSQSSTIMQDAHGNILQLNRAPHGFAGNLIQISAAPTQVTGGGGITGTTMITIPANLSHHLHSQVNSPIAVLPSGRKVLPVKLVSIPAKQTVNPGQTTTSTNLRSSPSILEGVNISSRAGSPQINLQGKIQVQTLSPATNLTLVPISLPAVTSTSSSGTVAAGKLLGLQQLKMNTSCPSNMVVMTSNTQPGTCIRVVRPGGIGLAGYKKDPIVTTKPEACSIKPQVSIQTPVPNEEINRPVAIVSAFKTSPAAVDNPQLNNHSNEQHLVDGEEIEVEDDLPPDLEADIIHDEKDLEAALAATNEFQTATKTTPFIQQNGMHEDEIPDIRESTASPVNKLLTPTSDSPPNLYPSYSRSPSPSSASDIHGEDQEIINTFAKSSDHTYGRSRSNSKSKQMDELSIEIPTVEDEVCSEHSSASSVRQQPLRSTRSNTRILSPDITAFTPSARSETPKHQLHQQQTRYRNSPKPSPTGSKEKLSSPNLSSNIGSPQNPIASSSARSSPVLPNCGSSGGGSPVVSRLSAVAKSSKRKRRESDDSSSTTSKDENSVIEETGKLIDLNSRPSKRRCSENAAELIKACIGVDETYKRLPPSSLAKDSLKAKDQKGKKLLLSVVSEETDDELEVNAMEHLLRGKSGSGRSSRGSSEDRSSSRGSSVNRQTSLPVRAVEEKETKPNTRVTNHRGKGTTKSNNNSHNHNVNSTPNNKKKDKPTVAASKLVVKDSSTKKSKSPSISKGKAVTATKKDGNSSTAVELAKVVSTVNLTSTTVSENSRRKTRSSGTGRLDSAGTSTFKRRRISKDTTIKTS